MSQGQDDYASYLLRLWRTGEGEPSAWRASLESTLTGQRRNFPNLEALFTFLNSRFRTEEPCGEAADSSASLVQE